VPTGALTGVPAHVISSGAQLLSTATSAVRGLTQGALPLTGGGPTLAPAVVSHAVAGAGQVAGAAVTTTTQTTGAAVSSTSQLAGRVLGSAAGALAR
jgi:hypothetical protein